MRLLNGMTLVERAVKVCVETGLNADICVSSDSDEILTIASKYKSVILHKRDLALCADGIEVDQILETITSYVERITGKYYNEIVFKECCTPFTTPSTMHRICNSDIKGMHGAIAWVKLPGWYAQNSIVGLHPLNFNSHWRKIHAHVYQLGSPGKFARSIVQDYTKLDATKFVTIEADPVEGLGIETPEQYAYA